MSNDGPVCSTRLPRALGQHDCHAAIWLDMYLFILLAAALLLFADQAAKEQVRMCVVSLDAIAHLQLTRGRISRSHD
jgi:hypothetical protein